MRRQRGRPASQAFWALALGLLASFFPCPVVFAENVSPGLPWPVREPFVIGAQCQDFQNYGGVAYIHGGLDIRAPAGTPVYSPVRGKVRVSRYHIDAGPTPPHFSYVRSPFSPGRTSSDRDRYVEVAILDDQGRNWMFRHIDGERIPRRLLDLAETDLAVPQGELLGTIIPWVESVYPNPAPYHHIHLEVLDDRERYLNPAALFAPRKDRRPPSIREIFLTPDESPRVFAENADGVPVVSGRIDLCARIEDQADEGGYLHAPFRVDLALEKETESGFEPIASPTTVFAFAELPMKGDRTQLGTVIYRRRIEAGKEIYQSQGDGAMRRAWLCLTNGSTAQGYRPEFAFDTTGFADGPYAFVITAYDLWGNRSVARKRFEILNRRASPTPAN